jgi:signal transduction histidine kinase
MATSGTARILIIDDEESIRVSCARIFEQEGYDAEKCCDGASGILQCESAPFDVIFIDLKMPGMSGMEVLERIHMQYDKTVLIVITGYATIESAVESMKKGAFDFLPKPFTPEELRVITKRALDHRHLLLESERLRQEKDRMKEKFMAMLSHQLKHPLAAVQQYFEVILGGMAGNLEDRQKEMLERSRIRIQELLKLIDSWLSFSRIDEHMLVREFVQLDLVEMLGQIVAFYAPVAHEKRVTIDLRTEGVVLVSGHRDFLREAFTNLVSNAINYNRPGGTVVLTVKNANNKVAVAVSDTGIGIDKEALPHIFSEFYRSARAKVFLGSGLGLSIVQRIIDAHKGTIHVESTVDVGSTFTVELPYCSGNAVH